MIQMINFEIRRAFHGRNFLFAVLIGAFISISHIFQNIIPLTEVLNAGVFEYPYSLFNTWIGGESTSLQSYIYFFLIPIIGTLPHAGTLQYDMKNKYIYQILVHRKKLDYLTSKFIATWISAGSAITIPLIINLVVTAIFVPAVVPESSAMTFGIFEISMWSNIYYSNPFLYVFGYLVIIFVIGGLFCCTSLITSYFSENKFAVLLSPFLLYLFCYFIIALFFDPQYNPLIFLHPAQSVPVNFNIILFEFLSMAVVIIPVFFIKGVKCEYL